MSKTLDELLKQVKSFVYEDHPTFWGCALAGEAGEAANILKKIERDGIDDEKVANLGEELVDVLIYIKLISNVFDIDLNYNLERKLDILDERRSKV